MPLLFIGGNKSLLNVIRLGIRVNALFFTGFGLSAVMGVVFNNTVVPVWGWNAMFIILGCFSVTSFIMLLFFKPAKQTFIPFDDERELFNAQSANGGVRTQGKKRLKRK